MKKIFILMLMLANGVVFGHEQNVHRYIVSEAWKLLTYEIPELSNTTMDPWIGSVGNTSYLTSVIAGAHNEDKQDIIYMNCGFQLDFFTWELVPCTKTTINHFWNADDGDYERVTIMNWNEENALQKAKHMWYGTHNHIIGVSFKPGGIADKIDHSGLPQLHNTGVVKWIGYWNSIGQYFSKNYNKTYSTAYRRKVAYSTLGRMCHLLADMSVPAHVHEDAHSPVSEDGTDGYEQWMKNNYSSYTWEDALSEGGTLFDVTDKEYPIRYLMYVVNQYADFYPSEGDWSGSYYGDDNYNDTYSGDYYPILNEIFSQLSTPPTSINHSVQAAHLMPFAIRATAALLYLFAVETGQYVPPMPSVTVSPSTNNVGTINGTEEIFSSFTIQNTGNVFFYGNVKTTNYTYDLDYINTPTFYENQINFSLNAGQSIIINYRGVVPANYGPFTETLNITTSIGNRTHSIVGSIALPDYCYGETQGKSASPEEQLFDGAFLGYFDFESDSIRYDKSKTIKERLSFAYDLLKQPKIEKVENICKMIIELYPESEMGISFYAMGLLWEASLSKEAPDFNEKELTSYLKKLTERKMKYKINGYAQLILSLLDVGKDVKGLEKLFSDYEYDGLKELALFHQFIHYYIYKQDKETARKVSDQLDKMFVDSKYGYQAHLIFGDDGYTLEGLKELIEKKQLSLLAKRGESKNDILSEMPTEYKLFNNYPNPFNPTTTIKYSVPKVSNVKLSVYNMMGQLIKTLVSETKAPGFYNVEWNGTNENNSSVASGIYFYRFESGNFIANNKMILIK